MRRASNVDAGPEGADPTVGRFDRHWTPTGYVDDDASSPALGKGDDKVELGTYGDSGEASHTQ